MSFSDLCFCCCSLCWGFALLFQSNEVPAGASSVNVTNLKLAAGHPCVPARPSKTRQLEDASTNRSTFCGLRGAFEQSRLNAGVEHALLEQLTFFSNAIIVLEGVGTHGSTLRRRVEAQTKRRELHVNAGTVSSTKNAGTQG